MTPKLPADSEELNLFPLHPENLVCHLSREPDDKDMAGDDVSWFLDPQDDAGTSMTGLLGESSSEDIPSSQTAFADVYSDDISGDLAATALRQRGCDRPESAVWVFCPNRMVVVTEDEGHHRSSTGYSWSSENYSYYGGGGGGGGKKDQEEVSSGGLSLKLDYEEILNAWSDKGSLYILDGDSPQTVPQQDDPAQLNTNPAMEMLYGGRNSASWRVPESRGEGDVEGTLGTREARVLRYKEKRQSRLFSKRIRYEVRKINAEKRPRMKGRFVKRTEEF